MFFQSYRRAATTTNLHHAEAWNLIGAHNFVIVRCLGDHIQMVAPKRKESFVSVLVRRAFFDYHSAEPTTTRAVGVKSKSFALLCGRELLPDMRPLVDRDSIRVFYRSLMKQLRIILNARRSQ